MYAAPTPTAPAAPEQPAGAAVPSSAGPAGAQCDTRARAHGRNPRRASALARSTPDLSWAQRAPGPRAEVRSARPQVEGSGCEVMSEGLGVRVPPSAQLPYALSSESSDCQRTASSDAEVGPSPSIGSPDPSSPDPSTATSGPAHGPRTQASQPVAAVNIVPERASRGTGTARSNAGAAPPPEHAEQHSTVQRPAKDAAVPAWVIACRAAAASSAPGGSGREARPAAAAGPAAAAHAGFAAHALGQKPKPAAPAPARPLVPKLPPLAELCALDDEDLDGHPAPCPGGAASSDAKVGLGAGVPARKQASLEEVRARIARRRAARAAAPVGGIWAHAAPEAGAYA